MAGISPLSQNLCYEAFSKALLDPDKDIPDGLGKNGRKAPKRFSVYRNNVVVGLMDALKTAYPSLLTIMGEENFLKVARNFMAIHPPRSAMMQHYGKEFPAFLKTFKPLSKSPFLADTALVEQKLLEAFHALDAAILEPDELGTVNLDTVMGLVFKIHPAAFLLRSDFPVHDLFNARHIWPCPGIDLANSQNVLITRPEYDCLVTPLSQVQAIFIEALIQGETLAQAIEEAMNKDRPFEPSIAIALMLQTGVFKSLNNLKEENATHS